MRGRDLPPITSNDCPSNMAIAVGGSWTRGRDDEQLQLACSPTLQVIAACSRVKRLHSSFPIFQKCPRSTLGASRLLGRSLLLSHPQRLNRSITSSVSSRSTSRR